MTMNFTDKIFYYYLLFVLTAGEKKNTYTHNYIVFLINIFNSYVFFFIFDD